jgi:steroid 5-alpha reductase family enzyme
VAFDAHLAWLSAVAIGIMMVLVWLVSLPIRNASIVDIFWGLGFVMVGWEGFAFGHGPFARRVLVVALTSLWGLRLAGYLSLRNLGHGEDRRYVAMRQKVGPSFPIVSLGMVFGLQGALMWTVSLPIQVAASASTPLSLGWLDGAGAAMTLVGIAFEATADAQLARFKRRRGSADAVLDTGLWRYTRHPNYFGDFLVWWGLFLVALQCPGGALTVVSPIVMSVLLMRVSGVTLLESTIVHRRPAYADYVRRTSAFFPRRPR